MNHLYSLLYHLSTTIKAKTTGAANNPYHPNPYTKPAVNKEATKMHPTSLALSRNNDFKFFKCTLLLSRAILSASHNHVPNRYQFRLSPVPIFSEDWGRRIYRYA